MGRFAKTHPTELTELVGNAVANGSPPRRVMDDLAAGRFPGWQGTYNMPLETVRYYGKQEKNLRATKTISPSVRASPVKAVDDLARLLLSAAERGLASARPKIDHDPKALKDWGDALKTIRQLVSEGAMQDKPRKGKQSTPSDPLTSALAAAATDSEPVPTSPSREGETSSDIGAENDATPTPDETHHAAGLLQEGSWSRPFTSSPLNGAGGGGVPVP